MIGRNQSLGFYGEQLAVNYLSEHSYSIVERNFRTRMGEIDVIAQKANTLHFVEVKTRIGTIKGMPYEAVTPTKIRHLMKAAQSYVLLNQKTGDKLSLDVISIILDSQRNLTSLRHYENITS